jgi:hypothetical protein
MPPQAPELNGFRAVLCKKFKLFLTNAGVPVTMKVEI